MAGGLGPALIVALVLWLLIGFFLFDTAEDLRVLGWIGAAEGILIPLLFTAATGCYLWFNRKQRSTARIIMVLVLAFVAGLVVSQVVAELSAAVV